MGDKKKTKCSNCNSPIEGKVYDILGDKYCETCYNKYNKIGALNGVQEDNTKEE